MIKNVLFWEKFRPKRIEQIILLPRIKKFVDNGIQTNLLIHGHMGTGKSSLIRVLLEGKTYKKINASLNNGIDLLREELYDFCTSRVSPFNQSDDKMKYVYLEEFDRTTLAFQEAFKAFVEDYDANVRFVITMNHVENVIPEIRSRFNKIDFNPQNEEERGFLKKGYFKYLKSILLYIKKTENYNIDDNIIDPIIIKNFPDLRSSVQDIQQIFITRDININIKNDNNFIYIYNYMMDGKNNVIENFDFIENNFSTDPVSLLRSLGKPFIEYIIKNDKKLFSDKGFHIMKLVKEHNETYDNHMVDPIIHLSNYVNEYKKIINE